MTIESPINDLLTLMARLRDPENGCPWDIAQNYKSIARHTVEEAYEVAEAAESGDVHALKDELGDLLMQVVFYAQMAKEAGDFTFDDVAAHVTQKMTARHPHVFGDQNADSAEDVTHIWEAQKDKEKKTTRTSILDDVPPNLPALQRAHKLQKRAAKIGFEWEKPEHVLDKLEEETAELRKAISAKSMAEIEDELGDVFFVLVNFARMLGLDGETCLRGANRKFDRRFRHVEQSISDLKAASLDEMEAAWQDAKRKEKRA